LYSLSVNKTVFKQKVALDNFSDDKLYGSTRFPHSALQQSDAEYDAKNKRKSTQRDANTAHWL